MSDDPTKDAWESVGDQAKDLGDSFKSHYEGADDSTSDEVKDALRTVGQGLEQLFTAIGSAIRDPEMQDKAKATGTSMLDAIGQTLNSVAVEVREAFQKRSGAAPGEDADPSAADTATEAAERELDDADAVDEIRADLKESPDE